MKKERDEMELEIREKVDAMSTDASNSEQHDDSSLNSSPSVVP